MREQQETNIQGGTECGKWSCQHRPRTLNSNANG